MDVIISAVTNRTGSTLVQRIFNARRKTLIWGEHGGIVTEFVRIGELAGHFSIQGREEKEAYFMSGENPNTWIANMSPDLERIKEGIVQAVKTCFRSMYAENRDNHDRIGFKEVRYGKPEIELLKTCYPDAVIVLMVRHPVDVWKSETSYWSGDAGLFGHTWNERALQYAELHNPERGLHLLRYEELVERDETALGLLEELADISRDKIDNVLNVNLNSTRTERPAADIEQIRTICQEGMERLRYMD
ncbi:sulfotransferase [Paenibacillus tyrfis]|uniref:sulfotransferase n=1 Tax=Paenibacillus tyrfis TaxID=1501230 RepID=UPI000B589FE9|nr:sulfotransferase [Paenibacillus tyrfis]